MPFWEVILIESASKRTQVEGPLNSNENSKIDDQPIQKGGNIQAEEASNQIPIGLTHN